MLQYILSLTFFISSFHQLTNADGHHDDEDENTILVNDVTSKYFVGIFTADPFPFAIGYCQPNAIVSTAGFQKFTCISETEVLRQVYGSDPTCNSTASSEEYYNTSDIVEGQFSGELYDFNCNEDAVSAYAKVEYTAGDCDSTGAFVTAYVALNVCLQTPDLGRTTLTTCRADPLLLQLQYYEFESSCEAENYMFQRNATAECGYVLTSFATGSARDIYGTALDCVNCGANCETTQDDDSGAYQVAKQYMHCVIGVIMAISLLLI